MPHLALKFAYIGNYFHGYQRQPAQKTVEGEIREALSALDRTPEGPGYSCASRTDKGVSALGNIIVLSSPLEPKELIGYLNAKLEHIHFHSYAEVEEGFNPRHATERWYRYLIPTLELEKEGAGAVEMGVYSRGKLHIFDLNLAIKGARMFLGTHDFTAFSKLEEGKDPVRTLKEVDVSMETGIPALPPFVVVDVRGESFLWMMVRYIVGAILEVATGECSADDIKGLLEDPGSGRKGGKPAPVDPEPLVLMDVSYPDVEFKKVGKLGKEFTEFIGGRMAELEIWKGLFR